MRRHAPAAAALPIALALAGCELAPAYRVPETPRPPAFREAAPAANGSAPGGPIPESWWTMFRDPELDALEARASVANQDVAAAVARLDQARSALRAAWAGLVPQLAAGADAEAGRLSRATTNPQPRSDLRLVAVHADAAWEPDLWGRARDRARSASARAEASAGDAAALALSVHAELASDYFELRGTDTRIHILAETEAAYARALALTRERFRAGYSAEPDVSSAEAALSLARTRAADERLRRATLEHAIASLAGVAPEDLRIEPRTGAAEPPSIEPGLPAALLQRRPDVAAAERRVEAANAGIGSARAALRPDFDLRASAGSQAAVPAALLTAPAAVWALGGSALLSIFDGDRRRAGVEQARAEWREAAADYRESVLRAFREVEDDLAAISALSEERRSQATAVLAAGRATLQARLRYEAGYASYLEVITAQAVELDASLAAANLRTRELTAHVALVKALGGGWRPGHTSRDLGTGAGPEANAPPPGHTEGEPPNFETKTDLHSSG